MQKKKIIDLIDFLRNSGIVEIKEKGIEKIQKSGIIVDLLRNQASRESKLQIPAIKEKRREKRCLRLR